MALPITFHRTLRTPYSERFVLQTKGADFAALDLHYTQDGRVSGTLCIVNSKICPSSKIPELLKQIDEVLLPEVSLKEHNLSFTVVEGKVHGHFTPTQE